MNRGEEQRDVHLARRKMVSSRSDEGKTGVSKQPSKLKPLKRGEIRVCRGFERKEEAGGTDMKVWSSGIYETKGEGSARRKRDASGRRGRTTYLIRPEGKESLGISVESIVSKFEETHVSVHSLPSGLNVQGPLGWRVRRTRRAV